jgi:hypothetical protein
MVKEVLLVGQEEVGTWVKVLCWGDLTKEERAGPCNVERTY